MQTLTGVTSVAVDSPSAGSITVVFTYANETFSQPAQITTVGEFPANPNWSRAHRLTNDAYQVLRYGSTPVAIEVTTLSALAVALQPSLSWPPYLTAQPVAATCAGNASATGTLTGSGSTNVSDGDTVTIGSQVYRFKTTMAQAFDVQIGGSGNSDTSLLNLINAINLSGTVGTNYFSGTTANTQVTAATSVTSHAFAVTAIAAGLRANAIATTKSSSVVSWGGSTLSGGTDSAANITLTAGATETTLSYQWQYSSDGGVTWTNCSGTINGTAYTNPTTATLTCTPTTQGQNGYLHRCVLTNSSGATNSNGVALTIS